MKRKLKSMMAPLRVGGCKAVAEALRGQMKVGHDIITMFEMNKVDGFDCPGCAWLTLYIQHHLIFVKMVQKQLQEATSKNNPRIFF